MYGKDLKVGIKVVPVIRTIDGPLSTSKEWATAQEKKQKFLWVVKVLEAPGKKPIYILAVSKDAKTGDKFASIDLRSMDWKGWDSRLPDAKHVTMETIRKNAAIKKATAAKKPAKKVAAKKPVAKKAEKKSPAKKLPKVAQPTLNPAGKVEPPFSSSPN